MNKIFVNLWFNNTAGEAAEFYTSVFPKSKITGTDYYTDVHEEITGHKKGDIVTVSYDVLNIHFIAINAGAEFSFTPATSFMVECKNQKQIDYYWEKLSSDPAAEQCGWLRDKYGLSWQIVPKKLGKMMSRGTERQKQLLTESFMSMKKFDLHELERVYRNAKE
jgi:Uncharacterized protein conserved in bacteria